MTDGYRIETRLLAPDEGGGYLAWAPELPGCMSDGESRHDAEENCRAAISEWLDHASQTGIEIPRPTGKRSVA